LTKGKETEVATKKEGRIDRNQRKTQWQRTRKNKGKHSDETT
jgi:hypothetical protein